MATALEKEITREFELKGVRTKVSMGPEGFTYQPVGRKAAVTIGHEELFNQLVANLGDDDEGKKFRKTFKELGLA